MKSHLKKNYQAFPPIEYYHMWNYCVRYTSQPRAVWNTQWRSTQRAGQNIQLTNKSENFIVVHTFQWSTNQFIWPLLWWYNSTSPLQGPSPFYCFLINTFHRKMECYNIKRQRVILIEWCSFLISEWLNVSVLFIRVILVLNLIGENDRGWHLCLVGLTNDLSIFREISRGSAHI